MYQAIEAISKSGVIQVLEPIEFEENEQLVVLRISKKWKAPETTSKSKSKDWRKFAGKLKTSSAFEGDPVNIQQEMRDEWD
jgi:predicted DNA-binding antitoxin AbrB/MazE fold protein